MGPYRVHCTLTFGDIYAQVLAWMGVIFASLATALGLMGQLEMVQWVQLEQWG